MYHNIMLDINWGGGGESGPSCPHLLNTPLLRYLYLRLPCDFMFSYAYNIHWFRIDVFYLENAIHMHLMSPS